MPVCVSKPEVPSASANVGAKGETNSRRKERRNVGGIDIRYVVRVFERVEESRASVKNKSCEYE